MSHLRSSHGYDEPEILPSSNHQFCLMSADVGHNIRTTALYVDANPVKLARILSDISW
jgi:hypothetical protein